MSELSDFHRKDISETVSTNAGYLHVVCSHPSFFASEWKNKPETKVTSNEGTYFEDERTKVTKVRCSVCLKEKGVGDE